VHKWQAIGGHLTAVWLLFVGCILCDSAILGVVVATPKRDKKLSVPSGRTRFTVRISERLADYLDAAVKLGVHGATNAEVARKFIENEIERLVREGMIKITPPVV